MKNKQKSIPTYKIEYAIKGYCEAKNFDHIDFVVAIARGGVELGKMFSLNLNKPMFIIDYSSNKGNGTGEHQDNINEFPTYPNKNLLIVDDIVDTGHTMHDVSEFYKKQSCNAEYFSLYLNEENEFGFECDCFQRLDKDSPWIVFPWESEWDDVYEYEVGPVIQQGGN